MATKTQTGTGYKIFLLLTDLLLAYVALGLALWLRYPEGMSWTVWANHAQPFTIVYLIWIVLFYLNNLYSFARIRDQLNVYFDLVRTLLIGTMIAIMVFYILPSTDLTPKRLLVINAGIFAILVALWRLWFVRVLGKFLPKNNVAIVGINLRSLELGRLMLGSPHSGYGLAALVGNGFETVKAPAGLHTIQVIENPYELSGSIKKHHINTVVLSDASPNQSLVGHLFEYLPWGVKFYSLPDFYEEFTYKIPVAHLNHSWFLNNLRETEKRTYDFIKRAIDVVLGIGLTLLASPILLLTAGLVKLDSYGPAIYRQKRVGRDNKIFVLYKFRTMVADAEKHGAQWSQVGDSRITRLGTFLRRTRLDELPQLINIIRGEMSLIGPRPERPEFVDELATKIPFYKTRHLVPPGLSGWAQVKFPYGASVSDAMEKLQYDLYYIKHRSLSLDLSIAIRTILIVLGFKGR